jgi:hypothetical protein
MTERTPRLRLPWTPWTWPGQGSISHLRDVWETPTSPAGVEAQGERQARHRHGMKESTSTSWRATATSSSSMKTWRSRPQRPGLKAPRPRHPADKKEVYDLLLESIAALIRETKTPSSPHGSRTPCSVRRPSLTSPPTDTQLSSLLQTLRNVNSSAAPRQEGGRGRTCGGLRGVGACWGICLQLRGANLPNASLLVCMSGGRGGV